MATSWNLFRIGRKPGNEDQLTEMLVWLAETVPGVGAALLQLAFDERSSEIGDVRLATQHGIAGGRLDALMISSNSALVVESKLGSSYGDGQVRRYLEWLETDFGTLPLRGLMTLTAHEGPWPPEDVAFASAHGIVGVARRWADLHEVLLPLTEDPEEHPVRPRLVREFLEMLSDEGLIPVKPLDPMELDTAWAESWKLVRRYRDFFHSCKVRIGEVLDASLISSSWSDRGDWFWQDYRLPNGFRVVVGLFYTDEFEKIPTSRRSRSPILFMASKADRDDWPTVMEKLEASPPEGWTIGNRWWNERATIWRPLGPLLAGGSFDDQRERLATAAGDAHLWIEVAHPTQLPSAAAVSPPDVDSEVSP